MKFTVLALCLSLAAVACNKKEESQPAADAAAVAAPAVEGHDKEHHHVTEGVDHGHDDAHHADHDHAAHHPNHDAEVGSDPHTAQ